jgi:hypothetical protein
MYFFHNFLIVYLIFLLTVEAKKQSSCSIHLVNKTDEYVAFKVGMQFETFKFMRGILECFLIM